MDRRDFLKTCAIGAGGLLLSGDNCAKVFGAGEKNRPNILWIIAEDLSLELGCYGEKLVKTPNIDKLASQGARYTNAFVTCPVCSPSRSAFMTGMYQTSIGCHQHRSHRYEEYKLPEPVKVITEYFRQAGYFTSNCAGLNWDKSGKTDFNFKYKKPYDGTDWRQRGQGQPFFAQINFSETHRIFRRDPDNPIDHNKVTLPPYYPDHPLAKRDWADYLEFIQILDKKVGKVLKRLEEDGLADNTIVLFFGDHGRAHVRDKQFLYDGGIHVPMIIRWPGHVEPAAVVDDMVSTIDFAPTFMKLVGIEPPEHLQGQVFMGEGAVKRDHIISARDRCDETVDRIRCVRTKRYKYIKNFMPERPYKQENLYKYHRYPAWTLLDVLHEQGKLTPEQELFMAQKRPAEELYDLSADPHEVNNLAEDPKKQDILQRMRKILDSWIVETKDRGEIPEDSDEGSRFTREFLTSYYGKEWKEQRGLPEKISKAEYIKFWEKELLGSGAKETEKK